MTKGQAGSKVQNSRVPGSNIQGSKVQGSKVRPGFQKCEVSNFQGSRGTEVPEVQSFKVPGFSGFEDQFSRCKVPRFQGSRVPGPGCFHGSRVPRVPRFQKFQGSRVPEVSKV